jgi:hypothetical protein
MYRWNLTNGKKCSSNRKDAKRIFPEGTEMTYKCNYLVRKEYSPARG